MPDSDLPNSINSTIGIIDEVLASEIEAINIARRNINSDFETAVKLVLNCKGHVVVSGLGKSGLVGQKISATLASTGTPSHFLHPTEAVHGDLGRIRRGDIVLLLSYSGRTEEVSSLAAILRQDGVPVISISQCADSQLGKLSDAPIVLGDIAEACQNGLAPTSTTTAMMAVGDALAIAASTLRQFSAEDFGRSHPGGSLGKKMLPVEQLLRFRVGKNTAVVRTDTKVNVMLDEAENVPRRCGAILVVDHDGVLKGILTDGDLRRLIVTEGAAVLQSEVGDKMTETPVYLNGSAPVRDALQIMREKRLDEIPVVDEQCMPLGVLDVQDLVSLKIIQDW